MFEEIPVRNMVAPAVARDDGRTEFGNQENFYVGVCIGMDGRP